MASEDKSETARSEQKHLFETAVQEFGRALDRLAAGYEADPDKRRDLRQEIYLQLWKSLEMFSGRCSLKTWTFRVAHNVAVTYVNRERRLHSRFASLEEIDLPSGYPEPDIDRDRALDYISRLLLQLRPLDRQILISYLEDMDIASIAEITGLSTGSVAMKIHRLKSVIARGFLKERDHA